MRLLSTCPVDGRCDTLQVMLWHGHAFVTHPFSGGFSVVDVSDPRFPTTVAHVPAPPGARTLHLQLIDGILVVTSEADMSSRAKYLDKSAYFGSQLDYGADDTGFEVGLQVFDVSTPSDPVEIRFMRIPGFGVHRLFWAGGATAVASEMPVGRSDFILTTLDMSEPTDPRVVSRWAPAAIDDEAVLQDGRVGLHHAILGGVGGTVAYGAWRGGGLQIVDVSTPEPALVGALAPSAWGGGNTHTTLPLSERNLVVVVDESVIDLGADGVRRNWLVDVADPSRPRVIGPLPEPAERDFRAAGGVFGPHNLHENRPGTWQSEDLVFGTYQNAGIRAWDISDPGAPREIAYLVPPPPSEWHDPRVSGGPLVPQTADVVVSADGLVIASDLNAGLSIMQFEGTSL